MIILISIFIISLIFYHIINYCNYRGNTLSKGETLLRKHDPLRPFCFDYFKTKELPTLPIEKFKNFYLVNTESWKLEEGIAYKKDKNREYISAIAFRPYFNYIKYEKFRKKIKQEKEIIDTTKAHRELLTIALESVQTDINNMREQANKERKESENIVYQIMEKYLRESGQLKG